MKCISTSSHPLPLIFANKRRKKKGVLKKETHSFLIGSPVTLTSRGQCRRECLGLSHSTVWNPLQGNAGVMVLVKAGIHTTEALNAGSDVLHTSLYWCLLAKPRPKASVLA